MGTPKVKGVIAFVLAVIGVALIWASGILTIQTQRVTIRNEGVKLAGTLATPRWASEPVPAVVVVHGSGRIRREDLRGYVRKLVPEGIAVLIFDKRGVSKSTGVFTNVTVQNSDERLRELASDVSQAVDLLAGHEKIDRARIGLVGGSQAGWIMPLATVENSNISFFISLSGPAVTFGEETFFSQLTGEDPGPYGNLSDDEIARNLAGFGGPYGFDPKPVLEDVHVPSLWLIGERDRSVPSEATQATLRMINPELFDVRLVQNADHDLVDVDSREKYDYWSEMIAWLHEIDVLP